MKTLKKLAAVLALVFAATFASPVVIPQSAAAATAASSTKVLNYSTLTIAVGQRVKITANTTKRVTWSSTDKKTAKVNSAGYVTGVSLGKTKVRAKVGSKYYYCTVKVVKPNTNEEFRNMSVGETYKIPLNISRTGVKWISTNPYVASVSSKGTVKVLRKGTAKIYAVVGGKKYIQMGVYSVDKDNGVLSYQSYSVADPNGGLPIIVRRPSIAEYIAREYDVVDISGYYPKNDGTLVSVSEAELVESEWYLQQYRINCAALTNADLADNGENTVYQKGDKYGRYTITDANTIIMKTEQLEELNYEYSDYGYNYGVMSTGVHAKGTLSLKCRIRYDDGPDGGYYIDGQTADELIAKYQIPTVTRNGAIYLNLNDSQTNTLDKYVTWNKPAEFLITIGDISSVRRGVYFDDMGFMLADVISLKYLGN